MKGEKKPVGLLIGIGRPKADEGPYESDAENSAEESDSESYDLKVTAMRALFSAIKGDDVEAAVDAYDALKEC